MPFGKASNVGYKIQVYTDLTNLKDPTSGTLQESATTEIKVNDITLCVTELTSSELLTKVLQVIRDVK